MNRRNMLGLATAAALVFLAAGPASVARAADLYSSGGKTWDTATANWGNAPGVYTGTIWNNTTPDNAFFEGTAGIISLGANITVSNIIFKTGAYTLNGGDKTLAFVAGGTITNSTPSMNQTIVSAITGSPSVDITSAGSSYATGITFAPTNGTVTLGTCTVPYNGGSGDKCLLTLDGTTTGNSITKIQREVGKNWARVEKKGSGTWSVGNADVGTINVIAGNLMATGTVHTYDAGLNLNGGVFHYNNAGAVYNSFNINASSFDNSSGAAITTPTYNPAQTWGGNWTFIGSQGANSDLNLGTGAVTLSATRTVTVSNALTTLTVGGAIGDGTSVFGLTKSGAGTLKLTGVNTYNGATTVAAGTLTLTRTCLDDTAFVAVSNGATLNLDYTGTDTVFAVAFDGVVAPAGQWGGPASGAANTTNLLSGTGILYHNGGLVATNTWYWDGSSYGGTGNGLSDGGSGVWSTTSNNWDQGFVSRKSWDNTSSNSKAIFGGTAGTVTLGEALTVSNITFTAAGSYTINGYTLNFPAGGAISNTVNGAYSQTISCGISGSPFVGVASDGTHSRQMVFAPASMPQTLGICMVPYNDGGGDKCEFVLGGTTAGNSVSAITYTPPSGGSMKYAQVTKEGSGTWSVGHVDTGQMYINNGAFLATGTVRTHWQYGLNLNGGVFHYNNAGAVYNDLRMNAGSFDNSSGAAITTSTYNPPQTWGGNWTFIGSQGTNSDLYLGNGAVALTVSPVVTINSNATLTVGGAVSGAFGLTKSGTGTLKLSGNNTYSGATMVTNGTLQLVAGGSCSNSAVTVTNTTGITSAFGVVVTNTARQAVCSNLTVSAVAGGAAQLKFSFGVSPSFVQAPLVIRNTVAFNNSPTLVVDPANLVAGKKYPLLTVGGTPPGTVPTLSIAGMSGSLAWEGNTLYLSMTPNGTLISFF